MAKQSLSELKKQISDLEAEILRRTSEEKIELRAEFDAKLNDAGLSIIDLYPELASRTAKANKLKNGKDGDAKGSGGKHYRDPQTGSLWSGRGRAPLWVEKILQEKSISLQAFKTSEEFQV